MIAVEPQTTFQPPALPFRQRRDLEISSQGAEAGWLLRDPLTEQFYRFSGEEYVLFSLLDGSKPFADIQVEFEKRCRPARISREEIQEFAARLVAAGLLISTAAGSAKKLVEQTQRKQQLETAAKGLNPLAIKIPLCRGDAWLTKLSPWGSWLFHPAVMTVHLIFAILTGLFIASRFQEVVMRLPALSECFHWRYLFSLLVVLSVVKMLHELGHGLCCKRYGGKVQELGVLFLFFAPCLYCNVTDSWKCNRWQRANIDAAGMYIELILASWATWIWWYTQPGLLHDLCLNLILVCSVSTLFVNANPCLRYDGYYLLSDLTNTPNLRTKAFSQLKAILAHIFFGIPREEGPVSSWLLLYAMCSLVYRVILIVSICWLLEKLFEPFRLELLGRSLMALVLLGLLLPLSVGFARFLRQQVPHVNPLRFLLTFAGCFGLMTAFVYVPIPQRVFCPVVLEVADPTRIYVTTPGVLDSVTVEPNQEVQAGELLAALSDPQQEFTLEELKKQIAQQEQQVRQLQQTRHLDPQAVLELPTAMQSLEDLQTQYREKQTDAEKLRILAPVAGRIISPPHKQRPPAEHTLATWQGTPFASKNLGAYLESGTLVCLIGEGNRFEATLLIDQADIEYVRVGQEVKLLFRGQLARTYQGEIAEIAQIELENIPPQLAAQLANPDTASSAGYLAKVQVEDPTQTLRCGMSGTAKVLVGEQTAYEWLKRLAFQTFHFRW